VVLDQQLDLECLRIPHFYSAFYVYKYATGISAAVALSERVLAQEPGSVEAYLNFLRSGGLKFPLETLQTAGVNMATSAPVESTLRLFERRLSELEELL
nr:oligoendopeptidase F [Chthoniobacterales bacterium]